MLSNRERLDISNSRKSLLRLDLGDVSNTDFKSILSEVKETVYKLGAKQHESPQITDCVTAVRYIIGRLTGESFPLMYIGDMPSNLLTTGFLGAEILPIQENKAGDLLFFHGISRFRTPMVKHVGICIQRGQYFHSLRKKDGSGGGTITGISEKYGNIATRHQILNSKDPRNGE